MPKKGASPSSARTAQARATSSGPTPAGSPSETATGKDTRRSAILDHRVATQVAKNASPALVNPLIFETVLHLVE